VPTHEGSLSVSSTHGIANCCNPCELSYAQIGWGWAAKWPGVSSGAFPFVGTIGQVNIVYAAPTQQQIQNQYAAAGH
jgi:hypothetical protein